MLVLSRRVNERILIGDEITITVLEFRGGRRVRIGIEAPEEIKINRAPRKGDEATEDGGGG